MANGVSKTSLKMFVSELICQVALSRHTLQFKHASYFRQTVIGFTARTKQGGE